MTESVSVEMFKIYVDSQSKHQTILHQELKETNKNLVSLIEVVREEVNTNKSILKEHIIEYNRDKQDYKIRFKNIFQRLVKFDGIFNERLPAFKTYKGIKAGTKKIVWLIISGSIIILLGYLAVKWGIQYRG